MYVDILNIIHYTCKILWEAQILNSGHRSKENCHNALLIAPSTFSNSLVKEQDYIFFSEIPISC